MSLNTIGQHQAQDLFLIAEERAELPRFFLPKNGGWQPIIWQQYAADVKALAGSLLHERVLNGDKVALLGHTSYPWILAYNAIQAVRGVVVPIYPASQSELIAYFLDHAEATLLFCDSHFLPILSKLPLSQVKAIVLLDDAEPEYELPIPVIPFQQALEQGLARHSLVEQVLSSATPEDLATIIYTSGTTGLPKGVMLTHANLEASAKDWISLNGTAIPEQAVDLHWLPLSHAFGIGAIMLGNRLGWQSYLTTPKDVLGLFTEIRPHLFLSVPAYWEKLHLKIQEQGGTSEAFAAVTGGRLVFALSGGAGLKKEIKEAFHRIGLLVLEGYGLTECSPTLTMNRRDHFNFDSVGVPYPSVQVKLAEDGEILAQGPNIFAGYYKDPKATHDAFDETGWFKTGDVGQWLEGGFLKIIDRKKEILVTSGGKNVPPQNIERLFQDNPYIQHLVVYGDGKKFLTALVTLNEPAVRQAVNDGTTGWSELLQREQVLSLVQEQIQQSNQVLASFESVKTFWLCPEPLTVEDNLLTASLKVRRKAVYHRYGEQLEALYQ